MQRKGLNKIELNAMSLCGLRVIIGVVCHLWKYHRPLHHNDCLSISCIRADSRLVPSQWETSLQSNAVSHWLGANLESSLCIVQRSPTWVTHRNLMTWYAGRSIHGNRNVVILMKWSSLAALDIVIWQLPMQPVMKISPNWWHLHFGVVNTYLTGSWETWQLFQICNQNTSSSLTSSILPLNCDFCTDLADYKSILVQALVIYDHGQNHLMNRCSHSLRYTHNFIPADITRWQWIIVFNV